MNSILKLVLLILILLAALLALRECKDTSPEPLCDGLEISSLPSTYPSDATTYLIKSAIPVTGEVSVPSQISFCIEEGGSFELAKDAQLTLAGGFTAPRISVFTGWTEPNFTDCGVPRPEEKVTLPIEITLFPEWFGALGDGVANDTRAMMRTGLAIEARDGGNIQFRQNARYRVGQQTFQGCDKTLNYAYTADPILQIKDTTQAVSIDGQGSTMVASPGLHFGSHDFETGDPFYPPSLPHLDWQHASNAYVMIEVRGNSEVLIENVELDGNSSTLEVGGEYGDHGRQNYATGLLALGNTKLTISNVYSHHHAHDGINIGQPDLIIENENTPPLTPTLLEDVVSEHNWRLGLALTGGVGVTIKRSAFNHQGLGPYWSSPASGIDIEEENSVIRNVLIEDTDMVNNKNWGLIAASGDTSGVKVVRSRLWGRVALVPAKPFMTFEDSLILGKVNSPWGEPVCDPITEPECDLSNPEHPDNRSEITQRVWGDGSSAVAFRGCLFEDLDPPTAPNPWSDEPTHYLIESTGTHGMLIEDSLIRTHFARSMFLGDLENHQILRDVLVIHGSTTISATPPANAWQTLMAGAYLVDVCFAESADMSTFEPTWYINPVSVKLDSDPRISSVTGSNVHVAGSGVRWASPTESGVWGLASTLTDAHPTQDFDNSTLSCDEPAASNVGPSISPGPGPDYTFGYISP